MSIRGKVGTEGQGHLGCLDTKRFHVSALLGDNPDDTSTWNALPKRPKRHDTVHQDVLRVPYMYVTKHTYTHPHVHICTPYQWAYTPSRISARALIQKVCVWGGGEMQEGRRGAVKVFAHVRVQHEKLMNQGDENWGKMTMKNLAICTTLPRDWYNKKVCLREP